MPAALEPELEAFARREVAHHLGSATRIAELSVLAAGDDRTVLLLTVVPQRRQLVMKLARDRAALDPERTAAAVTLARAAGAPVAEVLAADQSRSRGPWTYLLQEHVDGVLWRELRPLLTPPQVRSAHAQIAAAVLTVQTVRFAAFGELDGSGQATGHDLLPALHLRARLRIADSRRRDLMDEVLDRNSTLFSAGPAATLCHDDLHHGNLVFATDRDPPRLVGLLDWDKAWAGPAESDVARLAFWDDMTGPGFTDVYRAAVPEAEGAGRRSLIYQLMWGLEYDVPTLRHLADTVRLCQQLGVEPPASTDASTSSTPRSSTPPGA